MPIVHDRKLVFIHIPKTGGTSMSSHFFDFDSMKKLKFDKDRLIGSVISIGEGKYRRSSHCTAQEIKDLYPKYFEDYKKIAVVRNPFDRMLSVFEHLYIGRHTVPMIGEIQKISFDDFVSKVYDKWCEKEIYKLQTLKHEDKPFEDYYTLLIPQVEFLKIDGVISDQIRIYRFENFGEISSEFGITRKLNTNRRKNWGSNYHTRYHHPESIRKVQEMYKEDLEAFKYQYSSGD